MGKQEEGFVLVASVLLLVILSLLGVFSSRMAITEYQITGNERVYTESFYRSESLVMAMAQKIENEDKLNLAEAKVDSSGDGTATADSGLVSSGDISGYDSSNIVKIDSYFDSHGYKVNGNAQKKFFAVETGVTGSLKMTAGSQIHTFDVYGRSEENGTNKTVKIGFKRRF